MEFGAHLPVIVFGDTRPPTAKELLDYAVLAEELEYAAISANDHIIFRTGWLDALTLLAAVCMATKRVRLATTVLLPALRNPVVCAKALATLDLLSGGRLLVGVGAGSYLPDFEACGVPFEERWRRLDESIRVLRQLWSDQPARHDSPFYPLTDVRMEPKPLQRPGPPVWVGSWGSEAGLRRAARLGDGWIASAYNTTPSRFGADWDRVREYVRQFGKNAGQFDNAVVTMFSYITDDAAEAERVARTILQPALGRPAEDLMNALPLGRAQDCAEKVTQFAQAGARHIFIWPVVDVQRQLRLFAENVVPLVRR
ncbi:MAG: TIGR03619 family F420-dependent LLM class oxidoreductase [Deltaproteobacteria bacterium]|nr:TIGR03619 family F420-dependent LLM class oxidoreductase [Deltaproteobacteria bacterium]